MDKKTSNDVRDVVLDTSFAKSCIDYLRTRKIHRQFVGYLCICEASVLLGKNDSLQPSFKKFFDRFLVVDNPPEDTPYLVPFNESGSLEANVWLNSNVAGSYAPSSIRSQASLRRVVDIFGSAREARYALREDHEKLCLEYLLFQERIDPLALAGFLFRDHAFSLENNEQLQPSSLIHEVYALLGFSEGRADSAVLFEEGESAVVPFFSYSKAGENS